MPNIRVDLSSAPINGQTLTFRSPADCSQVEGLKVHYPENDTETSKTFQFADAHGNNVGSIGLFAENVLVKVILDTELERAYVQNADTNAYLEEQLASKVPIGLYSRGEFWVDSREDQETDTFWEQVIAIYNDMTPGTVELANGIVVADFKHVDPNEPPGGNYRVTITKSRDAKWGFLEAEIYHADAWGGPNRITRLKRDGKWQNAVNVSANIYEHVRREILWENASPASPLTGTLISLKDTVTKYNALLILVNMDTNLHYTIPVLIKYGGSSNGGVAYFPANSTQFDAVGRNNWSTQWRYFWWQGSKLKVKLDNLNGSETSFGATKCVPVRIYGLNL